MHLDSTMAHHQMIYSFPVLQWRWLRWLSNYRLFIGRMFREVPMQGLQNISTSINVTITLPTLEYLRHYLMLWLPLKSAG